MASWGTFSKLTLIKMRTLKYVLAIMVIGFTLASCEDPVVGPVREDDPIDIPPPPYKP